MTIRKGDKPVANNWITDEQVEDEIARLLNSPHVKLAQKERRVRYRRRQYMYGLRQLEKKGQQLAAEGITMEYLSSLADETEE